MMGGVFSFLVPVTSTSKDHPPSKPGLGDLPESCVASVLLYLDPPEICRLAMLNRAFRGASSADFIWESKLPTNYGSVIQRVYGDDEQGQGEGDGSHQFPKDLCKKDIYSRLCRSKAFDGGTKVRFFLPFSIGSYSIFVNLEINFFSVYGLCWPESY